jgi:hypothetical protein
MAVLIVFLAVYATVCTWFFVLLVKWTVQSERKCSCRGSMKGGMVGFIHSPRACYPVAESLHAMS